MTNYEKAMEHFQEIKDLYVNQYKTKSEIERILNIPRNNVRQVIDNHGLEQDESKYEEYRAKEFAKAHKDEIIDLLNRGMTNKEIYNKFQVGRLLFAKVCEVDDDIKFAKSISNVGTDFTDDTSDYSEELWRPIDGFSNYQVSNLGRVKTKYGIVRSHPNSITGRMYISLMGDDGKHYNLILPRIVANAFCDGKTKERNTVNHIDGDVKNNKASNLEWLTQQENEIHAYKYLDRKVPEFDHSKVLDIRYKGKEFNHISDFAKFIGLKNTQARRWTMEQHKHEGLTVRVYHRIRKRN